LLPMPSSTSVNDAAAKTVMSAACAGTNEKNAAANAAKASLIGLMPVPVISWTSNKYHARLGKDGALDGVSVQGAILFVGLDLDGGVRDRELVAQQIGNPPQFRIARMSRRNDKVTGERCFRCAHRPDMQVMQRADAGAVFEEAPHRLFVHARRNPMQSHFHGIAQQAPGPRHDHGGNEQ